MFYRFCEILRIYTPSKRYLNGKKDRPKRTKNFKSFIAIIGELLKLDRLLSDRLYIIKSVGSQVALPKKH